MGVFCVDRHLADKFSKSTFKEHYTKQLTQHRSEWVGSVATGSSIISTVLGIVRNRKSRDLY